LLHCYASELACAGQCAYIGQHGNLAAGPNELLNAVPKDIVPIKPQQLLAEQHSNEASQHSEDEDGDLLW